MSDFTDLDAKLEYEIAFALRNDMPVKSIAGRVRRICIEWSEGRPRGDDALHEESETAAMMFAEAGVMVEA